MRIESYIAELAIKVPLERSTNFLLSPVSLAVAGNVDRIISEEGHNAIEVIVVESFRELRNGIAYLGGLHISSPERFIHPVSELTLDLAVGVEMEYIEAFPTEPVSEDQAAFILDPSGKPIS